MATIARDRPLFVTSACCWFYFRISPYPADYLFVPDRDIWGLQVATLLWFALESFAIGLVSVVLVERIREALPRPRVPPPFPRSAGATSRLLRLRSAPILAGALSALAMAWVWGIRHPVPLIHDEAAYLLQAKLFASGRWTGPPAPIPEFFEQMYVFVTPFTAAKYPPGFAAVLVPGIWLGIPGLVPIGLAGISGGLLFGLARRISNEWVAGLTWLLWTTTPHHVWPITPFMSQHLSTALWLGSWWALLRWWKSGRTKYLALIGALVGMGAITRPLTMLVAALPIAFVVLLRVARRRAWKDVLAPLAVLALFLAVIPLWSWKTTGNWRVTPLALHVRTYTPYDQPGFTSTFPPPLRALPPDLQAITRVLSISRRFHTWGHLPTIAFNRALQIRANAFPNWRLSLVPLILYSLLVAPCSAWVAFTTVTLNFLAHLVIAHPVALTVYYLESYPVFAFLAGLGGTSLLIGVRRRPSAPSTPNARTLDSIAFALLLLLTVPAFNDLYQYRLRLELYRAGKERFEDSISSIPGRAVVFVRYNRLTESFTSLVENDPDLENERVWKVRDLGLDADRRLLRLAPDRTPYLYLLKSESLARLDPSLSNLLTGSRR